MSIWLIIFIEEGLMNKILQNTGKKGVIAGSFMKINIRDK